MTILPKPPAAGNAPAGDDDDAGRRVMLDSVPHWPDWLLIAAVSAADEAGDDELLATAAAELARRLDAPASAA